MRERARAPVAPPAPEIMRSASPTPVPSEARGETLTPDVSAGASHSEPALETATRKPREAWILHGDLAAALYQAGLIDTLARRRGLPAAIYAGGFSTLNAVLLACGGAAAVARGWEELRNKRLLFDEAVRQIPLLTALVGTGNRAERFVSKLLDDDALAKSEIDVHLSAGNLYFSPPSRTGGTKVKALAMAALAEKTASVRTWAKGIEEARGAGATSILLVGPPRGLERELRQQLAERGNGHGVRLETIPYETGEHPRPLDFLLPGSGVPERLIQDGQRVADAWLSTTSASIA